MENTLKTVKITLWANRIVAVAVVIAGIFMPFIHTGTTTIPGRVIIAVAFYLSAIATMLALWNVDKLLLNILERRVFTWDNVNCIRTVRWCCLAVSLICLPASVVFGLLIFMVVIMGFLSMMVNVVCQVMKAAVVMREESDLTI